MIDLRHLPGGARVQRGLQDLAGSRITADALAVAACSARLRRAGIAVVTPDTLPRELELALYEKLRLADPDQDAFFRYGAIRREIDSFLAAVDREADLHHTTR